MSHTRPDADKLDRGIIVISLVVVVGLYGVSPRGGTGAQPVLIPA